MINYHGQLIDFIDKNRICLGLIQNFKVNHFYILTTTDRQLTLSQSRIIFFSPSSISIDYPRKFLLNYLRDEENRREELAKKVDVVGLWELVREEKEILQLLTLAELTFSQPIYYEHISAIIRAFFNDRLYFRMLGREFQALTNEQLQRKIQQRNSEIINQAYLNESVDYLRSLPSSGLYPPPSFSLVKLLSDFMLLGENAPQSKIAQEIITRAKLTTRYQIFNILIRLGIYSPHQNLDLLREGLTQDFAPEILAQVNAIDSNLNFTNDRQDLTKLYTFTIDGSHTTDFDDALSFIPDGNGGGKLGIHIADVSALLPIGSLIDQEALIRGISLYLPDIRIPMLPPNFTQKILSLNVGLLRPAISCLVVLNSHGQVLNWQLVRSILIVKKRLTYEEVDEMLNINTELASLYVLMQAFRQQRKLEGGYFLSFPEVIVGVDDNWQVLIKRIDYESPARIMVAETAILANWLKARFLAERNISAFFRIQDPCREPIVEPESNDLYLRFKQRKLLNRVKFSNKPGLHAMLGLTPYIQATSPIRRFLDLVMQRQIAAILEGKPLPYTVEDLYKLQLSVESKIQQGIKIHQARKRYWLLVWLQGRQNKLLSAIIIGRQGYYWQILLTETLQLAYISSTENPQLELGQKIIVKIFKIDPFYDILKVKLV